MPVEIVIGSETDVAALDDAGIYKILDDLGIAWGLSVISAHRNPDELAALCEMVLARSEPHVFIAVAGMAAALPGAIAAATCQQIPVIAVPLDEHGIDSCLYMPPGVPVLLAGVGKAGLKNAALAAGQILYGNFADRIEKLVPYLAVVRKKAQVGVRKSGDQS